MKKLLLVIFTINSFAQAPNIEWQKLFGGSQYDRAYSIIQSLDGGYVICGSTQSNDFDVTQNNGYIDWWIIKLNSIGNLQWQKTFGGSSQDVAKSLIQTEDGGFIVSGYNLSIDGNLNSNDNIYAFCILKIDSTGNIDWYKTYGGSQVDYSNSVKETSDNGFIIVGSSNSDDGDVTGNNGGYDVWLTKLDSLGNLQWERNYGGTLNDYGNDVVVCEDGGYVIAGYTYSNNYDISTNKGSSDFWIIKVNPFGIIEWQKSLGGSEFDIAHSLIQDQNSDFVIIGYSSSTDFDVQSSYDDDVWIVKLDLFGNIIWKKSYGGSGSDGGYSITQSNDSGYVFAAVSNSNNGDLNSNNGYDDTWIVKLDINGNILWQKSIGGSNSDYVNSIKKASDGGYFFSGHSNSNNINLTINNGNYDFWVVKLSPEQLSNSTFQQLVMNVSPNPAYHYINLYLSNDYIINEIKIIDVTGKLIVNEIKNTNQIDISNLSKGLYFIEVFSKNNKYQSKFIKQ